SEKIKELGLEGTQRDEYYAWGLNQIAKAVSFLNNDCKLDDGSSECRSWSRRRWHRRSLNLDLEGDGGAGTGAECHVGRRSEPESNLNLVCWVGGRISTRFAG
ncbi:hypothetical protein LINPERPRIM_LOCUS20722, partial [Linum perenne]